MNQIESFLERPKLYYNIDGVGELGIGFMCLGWSLLGWLQLQYAQYVRMASDVHVCDLRRGDDLRHSLRQQGDKEPHHLSEDRVCRLRASLQGLGPDGDVRGSQCPAHGGVIVAGRHWDDSTPSSPGSGVRRNLCPIARTVRWKWAIFAAIVAATLVIAAPGGCAGGFGEPYRFGVRTGQCGGSVLLTVAVYGALLILSGGISFWLYLRHTQAPAQEGQ
jgi:hypothetical protein